MLRPFIVIGFLSGATGALADPVPLSNDELKSTVSGSVVEIDTPLGSTVPMRFGADGLVSAEAGVLAPVLGAAKDRGRWWVDGEKLCTKWFRWFDAGVRCLTIARDGSRIYWRKIDDGETGTGTLIGGGAAKEAPAKPAVVAKVEPAPAREKPAAQDEKKPVAKKEKAATRLAGPEPEAPAETPAAQDSPPATQDPAPVTVVQVEVTPVTPAETSSTPESKAEDSLEDGPTMRFGGAGLLEASTRVGSVAQAPQPHVTQSEGAAPQAPVSALPKLPEKSKASAPVKTVKKANAQRQASLHAPTKRAQQKRKPSGQDRDSATATSSSRVLAPLYKVTRVERYDVLNVRQGPSERHVSIAAIPPTGRSVEIVGECQADWCPIRYGGVRGWVNSFYLAEEGTREGTSSEASVVRR